jgi:predicted CopG family antitoxin
MANANKRIPVTEDRRKELSELKDSSQTYDELLEQLIQQHRERRLAEMVRDKRDDGFVEISADEW